MGSTRARPTTLRRTGGDVTKETTRRPLPQNEIVRVRPHSQGPVREGRAPTHRTATQSVAERSSKAANHPPVIRERSNNQCSTG